MSEKMRIADDAVMIRGPGVVVSMRLRPGHCFVMLVRGSPPRIAPDDGPGTYEIDLLAIAPDAEFPVLILSIPRKYAHIFANSAASISDSAIDQALLNTHSGRA